LDRIRALKSRGVSERKISQISGVCRPFLAALSRGDIATVSPRVEERILSVPVGTAPALGVKIPAAKTSRQIRWLLVEGFTPDTLAERINVASYTVVRVVRGDHRNVTVRTAARVDGLWREMQL